MGFIQEYRAEKAIESLKKIAAPYAKVIREGEEKRIPAKELVVGDIVVLEEGDVVPADLRLTEVFELKIDESSLTGESNPVFKKTEPIKENVIINDQTNMAFMGTVVTFGKGKGVVVNTGMNTEFGKIASSIGEIDEQTTPLQEKFEKMAKQLTIIVCHWLF